MPERGKRTRLVIIAATVLLLVGIAILLSVGNNSNSGKLGRVECNSTEFADTPAHTHSHLALKINGVSEHVLDANIGIGPTCFYWLHTHASDGILHVEPPATQEATKFTLQDFADVWGKPINNHQVGNYKFPAGAKVSAYIEFPRGSSGTFTKAKRWHGPISQIPLIDLSIIEIQVGKHVKTSPWVWPQLSPQK